MARDFRYILKIFLLILFIDSGQSRWTSIVTAICRTGSDPSEAAAARSPPCERSCCTSRTSWWPCPAIHSYTLEQCHKTFFAASGRATKYGHILTDDWSHLMRHLHQFEAYSKDILIIRCYYTKVLRSLLSASNHTTKLALIWHQLW